jgi:hypothetical protein
MQSTPTGAQGAFQEAAWNSTPVIKTKLKGLHFPKEIAENVTLEENGISQEIHTTEIS